MRTGGQRILITGGGSGIGLALATRLAPSNTVVIAGRDEAKLERARSDLRSLRTVKLDVTAENDARNAITRIHEQLGGLDVLVNNAGVMYSYALADSDADTRSEEEIQINLLGSLRMTRLALPLLREAEDAAVVFLSSGLALSPAPGLAVYSATKAAVHSMARSLRDELAQDSIRVFDVLPPLVDTELARGLDVPKISPESVADAVVDGLARDPDEILVGEVRSLALVARLAPSVASRLVARATRATGPAASRFSALGDKSPASAKEDR